MNMSQSKIKPFYQGKVRDLYSPLDDQGSMIIVASDRISAFDVIFNELLSGKGKVLTRISNHWFNLIKNNLTLPDGKSVQNHIIETDSKKFPQEFADFADDWQESAVWVKRLNRVDFECVVRGYIIGSGWKEYRENGRVCGIKLPQGFKMAQKLDSPIFTPATKAETGHDENVSFSVMSEGIGQELATTLRDLSMAIYSYAEKKLFEKGIILADTKFEFGLDEAGGIVLIDEVLTPDSSRFWDVDEYRPGKSPPSYDKQIIRDYLETTSWNKMPPPPSIPGEIIEKTMKRYQEIEGKITSIS